MAHNNPWPDEGNTGHIWDEDIRELDNPPPLWWMLSFYAGFVMIVFYALYYPTIPWENSWFKGYAGWTQIEEYDEEVQVLQNWRKKRFAEQEEQLAALPVSEILKNEELKTYAVKTSKVLFGDYCAACHGAGGQGNPDFPVLADDDWLWGGKPAQIEASITNGRIGNMPARGMMGNLTDKEIDQVADYVIALSEGKGNEPAYAAGKAVYAKGMCLACHGPAGKPLAPTGATNFTDGVWRFGGDKADVIRTITYGVNVKKNGEPIKGTRLAVMPAFKDRLPDPEVNIKRLTVYVYSLGGGQ
ncbi:cytochrome-c oxidase, cbb3-type subunit III [Hydrogenovibrio thermophilus]|jgi:cytochrome c oxidase cbb3-type subunit 3|uniref:Cbb3-type cytochrome c oxidase subunit n=1 Tax=Hydrogenovibrio thermophilus TaxID=265883 RepID=A0A410H5B0_9GAMM|nr:cytochrome-c oxidase, cbb3-type subunit III [Hydrogenovibrio thermophilus]QAB16122.1 cytochrome-c oxidase, cbb3-type subunit III [Hydrogenovibrio thermophilus]